MNEQRIKNSLSIEETKTICKKQSFILIYIEIIDICMEYSLRHLQDQRKNKEIQGLRCAETHPLFSNKCIDNIK